MSIYQKLAKWSLIILAINIVLFFALFGGAAFEVGYISLAFGSLIGPIIVASPFILMPGILIYSHILYKKNKFHSTLIVACMSMILMAMLTVFVALPIRKGTTGSYDPTLRDKMDLTLGRNVEDCGSDQLTTHNLNSLGGTELQNPCYYQFAISKIDTSICERIIDTSLQKKCVSEIQTGSSK